MVVMGLFSAAPDPRLFSWEHDLTCTDVRWRVGYLLDRAYRRL